MAEVWKAKIHGAQNFQRLVVVKRILPHLSSDPTFVRMFTDEAVVSARLNHPNIVQVFEFSEVAGEHYLAMEFVHGVNVGEIQKLLGDVRVPVGMAAHIVREVCLALAYAHGFEDEDGRRLSIIHRDVSPSNVMIGYDGSVRLLDFGVAKVLSHSDEMTRTGALKGKVGYMSPEAIEGDLELDARTDLFSAGVVLHELLAGKRLFKGHDDLRTIALVRACRVPTPSTLRSEVTPLLDQIVLKALARDRDQRYQSARELADALSRVVHECKWDAARTAAFLKERMIQPGSEPELKAGTPPAVVRGLVAPPPDSPQTLRITVVERRGRSGPNETPRPVTQASAGWALAGAMSALGTILALGAGWRLVDGAPMAETPVTATTRMVEEAPRAPAPTVVPIATATEPRAVNAAPAGELADDALEGGNLPASAVDAAPAARPVAAPSKGRAATTEVRAKRRRKGPKRAKEPAPAAASNAPATPAVDLKRGDVVKTF
jgi:hypothetical protein